MTLYLKNARFIDWQSLEISHTDLAVESGQNGTTSLSSTVPGNDALAAEDQIIDCKGKFVTKSFGCGHHHIYSTLARGMPAPRTIPTNFSEVLEYVWWHIDKRLDLEMIEASALASAIYCAKNGVTFVIDHHASPFAIEGSLETIAKAFDRVGISHMLCYEMSDRDGAEIREQGLTETDAFLTSGRAGHVGLHASFTVGKKLLADSIVLAKKHQTGLHIHVAEDNADQEHAQANFGKRVMERLSDAGALELKKSIFGHCIHLSQRCRGSGTEKINFWSLHSPFPQGTSIIAKFWRLGGSECREQPEQQCGCGRLRRPCRPDDARNRWHALRYASQCQSGLPYRTGYRRHRF